MKKITIVILVVLLGVLALMPINGVALAAEPMPNDNETILGPINVVKVVDVQRLSYEQGPNITALKPGGYIGQAVFQVTNLITDPLYVNQSCWMETPQGSSLPFRIEYTVENGKQVENYGSLFCVDGNKVMRLTVKVYAAVWTQPVKGAKLHIYKPTLTEAPRVSPGPG